MDWRGKPLTRLATIVSLVASTRTEAGLTVRSEIDPRPYQTGVPVSNKQVSTIAIRRHRFHGDWNYTIQPGT